MARRVWLAEVAGIAAGIAALMDSAKYCAAHAVDVTAGARLRRRFAGGNPLPFHSLWISVLFIWATRRDGRLAQCENDNVDASAEGYLPDSRSIMEMK
jgi:hypothetical protein